MQARPKSVGLEHCTLEKDKNSKGIQVHCKHCTWTAGYSDPVVAKRMASNHIVKKHPDIAKPVSQVLSEDAKPKRGYNRKQAESLVRFCPCCGTNLEAVRVAISL